MINSIIIFGIIIVSTITLLIFYILFNLANRNKDNKIKLKESVILFFIGGIVLLFLHFFLYSIGRDLSVNLFFFEIKIVGLDFFENFENTYKENISNLGKFSTILYFLSSFIIPAIMEEVGKFLGFWKYYKDKVSSIIKVVYGIGFTALGFAFFENLTYLINFTEYSSISKMLGFGIYRGFISSLSHVLFSMIVGYFIGKKIFYKYGIIDSKKISIYSRIRKISKTIHGNSKLLVKVYSSRLIIYGFSISIILHILYNTFATNNMIILSIIILFIPVIYFIFFIEDEKKYQHNYVDISEKINYLKKLKEFKDKNKK